MSTSRIPFVLATCAALGACTADPTAAPVAARTASLAAPAHDQVDLLLVVDDSPNMKPKQAELVARLPELLHRLDAAAMSGLPASYHIGVISTDLGAGPTVAAQCQPGGKRGELIVRGAAAAPACRPPTGGMRFVEYDQRTGTSNLPPGQDLATTLACAASLGDQGCGFEHPLEASYRALHDVPVANQGFRRPGAQLVVVFVTDEDDCSAPPDTRLFRPDASEFGAFASFRCPAFGLECGPGAPLGSLPDGTYACTPRTGGPLLDVQRYVSFFRAQDAILVALAAPADPVRKLTARKTPGADGSYVACAPGDPACLPTLDRSCHDAAVPGRFGDPAPRLAAVVRSRPRAQQQLSSICEASYDAALLGVGERIAAALAPPGCIDGRLTDPGSPDCVVREVTARPDGSTEVRALPACRPGEALPCWNVVDDPRCPASSLRVDVDRGGLDVPPATTVSAACATEPTGF
jgi:hypothetical protein